MNTGATWHSVYGRGTEFCVPAARIVHRDGAVIIVRDGGGDGPVVVLLHGWCADGLLNFAGAFAPLRDAGWRVVSVDLPGHGGSRDSKPFSLMRCRDVVGYVLDDLGIGRVVVGGYSMGGPISQLLARERTDQVMGLVEMSTAAHLVPRPVFKSGLRVGMRFWDAGSWIGHQGWELWGGGGEQSGAESGAGSHEESDEKLLSHAGWVVRHNDHRALTAAGHELSHYDAREWVGDLHIPVSCVITAKDRMVPRSAQLELAELTEAVVFEVGHGHGFCTHGEFGSAVVQACDSVLARGGKGGTKKAKARQRVK